MDWNSDRTWDIVSGDREGYFNVFLATDSGLTAYKQCKLMDSTVLDVGYNSQPTVADWNGDGMRDLILGTEDGLIRLYLNQTSDSWPMFQAYDTLCAGATPGVPINLYRVNPYVFDLDRDGAQDLICGANDGYVRFYWNTGSNEAPVLAAAETLKTLEGTPILASGSYSGSRCGFGYWDADTLPDFLLSAYDGTVALYRGAELTGIEAGQTPAVFRLGLSPNPASRSVTVCLPAAIPLSVSPAIKVLDARGRLVLSRPAGASTVVLDVSTLPAGVYVCRFEAGRYAASQRLVVSR